VLKLIKVLKRKKINIELLAQSKVGKSMTRITETKFRDKAIVENAQNLLNCWKQMAKAEKAKKQVQTEREERDKKEEQEIENHKLPYIPKEVQRRIFDLCDNDKIAHKFIETLQKHPDSNKRHNAKALTRAAEVGVEIAE